MSEDRKVKCGNCDWEGTESQMGKSLFEMHKLWDRVAPGEECPAGECPECGACVHLYHDVAPLPGYGEKSVVISQSALSVLLDAAEARVDQWETRAKAGDPNGSNWDSEHKAGTLPDDVLEASHIEAANIATALRDALKQGYDAPEVVLDVRALLAFVRWCAALKKDGEEIEGEDDPYDMPSDQAVDLVATCVSQARVLLGMKEG